MNIAGIGYGWLASRGRVNVVPWYRAGPLDRLRGMMWIEIGGGGIVHDGVWFGPWRVETPKIGGGFKVGDGVVNVNIHDPGMRIAIGVEA